MNDSDMKYRKPRIKLTNERYLVTVHINDQTVCFLIKTFVCINDMVNRRRGSGAERERERERGMGVGVERPRERDGATEI